MQEQWRMRRVEMQCYAGKIPIKDDQATVCEQIVFVNNRLLFAKIISRSLDSSAAWFWRIRMWKKRGIEQQSMG